MILSKKQIQLFNDIISPNVPEISVLGSTQSGKTYDICHAMIQYARVLNEYEKEQKSGVRPQDSPVRILLFRVPAFGGEPGMQRLPHCAYRSAS